ncbi:WD-repeat protein [Cylindrospermum sp. NIES-4074]|nr:WD-repeat protein [Cylindrospermum sp. NIES-4074]
MTSLGDSQDSTASATVATKRLARAMMVAAGEFSLILACCNSAQKQQQVLNLLRESSSADIQEIVLPPASETLYTTITAALGDAQPEALIVGGLESVEGINQLLISTNLMRNEFRKTFNFPLVLWVNEEILCKLVWLAPDLKDWAASTIRFDAPHNLLIEQAPLSA